MSHKNALDIYDELLAAGFTEEQSRIQAQQLDSVSDSFWKTIERIDKKLDRLDSDLGWLKFIGALIFAATLAVVFKTP